MIFAPFVVSPILTLVPATPAVLVTIFIVVVVVHFAVPTFVMPAATLLISPRRAFLDNLVVSRRIVVSTLWLGLHLIPVVVLVVVCLVIYVIIDYL